MNPNDPLSVADHCDPQDEFEVACRRHLRRLHAENLKLRKILLRHIKIYRVDDDAYDKQAEAKKMLEAELCR